MIVKTLQILWHDNQPVLSCAFHGCGEFVTAGADHEVKVRAREGPRTCRSYRLARRPVDPLTCT